MAKSFEELHEENRLYGHLRPMELPNKREYLSDLHNIAFSTTGQIDIMFLNAFMFECEALIINAIALFEKGYFDCAYYSLRQTMELANNISYFSELNATEREIQLKKWKSGGNFNARDVGNFLNNYADNYREIKVVFSDYIAKSKHSRDTLNILIHKQGFDTFYAFHRNFNESQIEKETEMFTRFLETTIAIVSILRLSVDPFPILLHDEEVYFRLPDTMTESYSYEFLSKYIGEEYIEDYKKTDLYTSHYEGIISSIEKKSPATAALIAFQAIDTEKIDEYAEQVHLLGAHDRLALIVACLSPKISHIYTNDGFGWYHTNIRSERVNSGYSSATIQSFKADGNIFNRDFENIFMSYLTSPKVDYGAFGEEDFSIFIEHNQPFEEAEIILIQEKYAEIVENFKRDIVEQSE